MKKLCLFAVLLVAVLVGCEQQQAEKKAEGAITLTVDRDVIMADNEYAAKLTVTVMDSLGVEHDVTSEVEIYCEGMIEQLASSEFKTGDEGTYSFYAVNGFEISNTVTVRAVKGAQALPQDTNPSATNFRHKMLLLQHTGTECPNCPKLMTQLRYLSEDEKYNSLYHHVASHSYNASDPAYTSAATSLSKNFEVSYYPWLTYNLTATAEMDYYNIKSTIDKLYHESADAGVSAAVSLSGNYVCANLGIKAGKAGKYRLAAWLLEDNIRAAQSGADAQWQNMHENCLRLMNGANKTEQIYGKNMGEFEAGQIKDLLVAFDLGTQWKGENCKVIVIAVDATTYELVTCAVCPVGETVNYNYL